MTAKPAPAPGTAARIAGRAAAEVTGKLYSAQQRSVQRLRRRIAGDALRADNGATVRYTISIGLASRRPQPDSVADLMRCADSARYKAKRKGRNRVEGWFESV